MTNDYHLKIVAEKCRNFEVNAYFYTIFVPNAQAALPFCTALPSQFQTIIADHLSSPTVKSWIPGDTSSNPEAELVFTGRIYIYTESDFSPAEIGDLYKSFRTKNMVVQFRGREYTIHHWGEYYRRVNNNLQLFFKDNPDMFPRL